MLKLTKKNLEELVELAVHTVIEDEDGMVVTLTMEATLGLHEARKKHAEKALEALTKSVAPAAASKLAEKTVCAAPILFVENFKFQIGGICFPWFLISRGRPALGSFTPLLRCTDVYF